MRSLLVCAAMLLSVQTVFACKMSESHRAVIMFDEALKIIKTGNLYNGETINSMKIDNDHVNIISTNNETGECLMTTVNVHIRPDCSVFAMPTAGIYTCE